MKQEICKHCGQTREDHCTFEAIKHPPSCVCDLKSWGNWQTKGIPSVCKEYKGDGEDYCLTCEHTKECHT